MSTEFQALLSATERPQRPEGATRHFFYAVFLVAANLAYFATAFFAFVGYFVTTSRLSVPEDVQRQTAGSPFTFPSAMQVSQVWIEYLALVIGCYVIARAFSYFAQSFSPKGND